RAPPLWARPASNGRRRRQTTTAATPQATTGPHTVTTPTSAPCPRSSSLPGQGIIDDGRPDRGQAPAGQGGRDVSELACPVADPPPVPSGDPVAYGHGNFHDPQTG